MRKKVKIGIEVFAIALIAFGIFSLVQPFTLALYQRGFTILLVGLGLFIVITHIKR